jgi:hypothetical protein
MIALPIRKRLKRSATVPYAMFGSSKAWSKPHIANIDEARRIAANSTQLP